MQISLSEMKRTWFSLVMLYPSGVRAILKAIKTINDERTTDRLDVAVLLECAKLHNDVEVLEGGFNDCNWLEKFRIRDVSYQLRRASNVVSQNEWFDAMLTCEPQFKLRYQLCYEPREIYLSAII